MPQLAALYKKNQDKGFVLVGLHLQQASDAEIADVVKKNKVKFPITTGGSIPSKGSGIPHTLLFDVEGKCVFEGHPSDADFEKAIKKALKGVVAAKADDSKAKPATSASATAAKSLVPEREWVSTDGRAMRAELVSVKDDTGTFRMKAGKAFPLKLDKLCDADRKFITDAVAKAEKAAADAKAQN